MKKVLGLICLFIFLINGGYGQAILDSSNVTPTTVNVSPSGATVTVDLWLRNSPDSLWFVFVYIGHPDSAQATGFGELIQGTKLNGKWRSQLYLPASTPIGTYPVYAQTYDESFDMATFNTGKTVQVTSEDREAPTLLNISPTEGAPGTLVTINGTYFDPVPSNNIVYFGAVRAEVTAANSTSLTVKVPVGTTYSPITLTINGLTAYSKEPFFVTFPSDGVIDNTSFASKVDFGSGKSVAIADMDGDGKSDLIVANSSGGVVSVFRNISTAGIINSGSFAPKVDFAVGSWPFGVITADIDGDGKLDIAVANQGGNSISVLRNTSTAGNLSFAPKVDFSTGRNPWLLAVGDLNGDGKSDIVNTNYDTSTVSVLKNQSSVGNISFAARQDYFVGNNPTGVSVRDFNEDGQPDLAVVVSSLNVVSIFKNVSLPDTILFEPKQDFSTGTNPQNIAVGDLQDDDKPDLAVPNVGGTSISILKNTSLSGTISFDRQDISVGVNPKNVQIADINGDAKPDLVFAGSDNTVSVLKNSGSGGSLSFAPRVSYATNINPWLAAIGDLDGDGKSDISVANGGSNNMSVLRNKIVSTVIQVTMIFPLIFGHEEKTVYYRKGKIRNGTGTSQAKKI
jgi:hypothetical protein